MSDDYDDLKKQLAQLQQNLDSDRRATAREAAREHFATRCPSAIAAQHAAGAFMLKHDEFSPELADLWLSTDGSFFKRTRPSAGARKLTRRDERMKLIARALFSEG